MNMNGVYPAPGYSQQIPYQASYGYNPYGNQQRIEQPQNYFQPAQTQQIQQTQMTPIGINGKIVPSVENITADRWKRGVFPKAGYVGNIRQKLELRWYNPHNRF